jgi:hypothetical protein
MKKPAINMRKRINKRHTALFVPLLMLTAGQSPAQNDESDIAMSGIEVIDPNEMVSGGAVVGINFHAKEDVFDLNAVYVYFTDEPSEFIKAQLTTVDGRYVFEADPTHPTENLKGQWRRLSLKHRFEENGSKVERPLNAAFLNENYNKENGNKDGDEDLDREIAILVTDSNHRAFPVRWGVKCETEIIRIRVNAEGADAYFIKLDDRDDRNDDEPDATLVECDEASEKSLFKFDHNCDMRWQDVQYLAQNSATKGEIQIIRKRGATYDESIPVKIGTPESQSVPTLQNGGDQEKP